MLDDSPAVIQMAEISDIHITRESQAAVLVDVPVAQCPAVLKIASETSGGKITAKALTQAKEEVVEEEGDDDLSWHNDHVADFTAPAPADKKTAAASKLFAAERREVISQPEKLLDDLRSAERRICRLAKAFGQPDSPLAEAQKLIHTAIKVVEQSQRNWTSRRNKITEAGR